MQQKVILLWPWNIWRTFLKQVLKYDSIKVWKHNNPTVIMWVANYDKILFSPLWLTDDSLEYIVKTWELWPNSQEINSSLEVLDMVDNAWLNWEIIFVDATWAKDSMRDFHLAVMEKSDNWIVTANKNPISLYDFDIYKRLTKNLRYQYTTSVMAWSWIIRFLRWTRKISDKIYSISWVFSWTLWYITSELDKWKKISEVVKQAHKLWYTEPNPWDDLNWLDVARKLIILWRSAWHKIDVSDISIEPLLPKHFWEIKKIDDFLDEIKSEDDAFTKKISEAQKKWNALRYVASLEQKWNKLNLSVWLKEVKIDSPLWRLHWPANFVEVVSDLYNPESTYILQTPWAWLEVTAWSLRKDMLSFLPRLDKVRDSRYKYK